METISFPGSLRPQLFQCQCDQRCCVWSHHRYLIPIQNWLRNIEKNVFLLLRYLRFWVVLETVFSLYALFQGMIVNLYSNNTCLVPISLKNSLGYLFLWSCVSHLTSAYFLFWEKSFWSCFSDFKPLLFQYTNKFWFLTHKNRGNFSQLGTRSDPH